MNLEEYKKVLDILPMGFAFYSDRGVLTFSNKYSKGKTLFPNKLLNLNIPSRERKKLKKGTTIFVSNTSNSQFILKPIKKLADGCVVLAQDTKDCGGYVYLATHDFMTELYNRNFFETEFDRLKNSRDFPVLIIYVDIDQLKKINDKYGHDEGDKAIIKVAEIIKKSIRKYDIAARVGGDEFVILVPKANEEIAQRIIGRISKHLESYNKRASKIIKVSLGFAVAKTKIEMKKKLTEADALMYTQKKAK